MRQEAVWETDTERDSFLKGGPEKPQGCVQELGMSAVGLPVGGAVHSAGQGADMEMHTRPRAQKKPRELEICPELGGSLHGTCSREHFLVLSALKWVIVVGTSAPAVGGSLPLPACLISSKARARHPSNDQLLMRMTVTQGSRARHKGRFQHLSE